MPLHHNVSATWKNSILWHNVAGTWKKVALHHNVSGVWKPITTLISASLPSSMWANGFSFVPTAAYAAISVQSGGTWSATNDGSGTWLTSGSASEFEVRLTGSGTHTPGGAALNTWLQLITTRYWDFSTTGAGYSYKSFSGTLEIRPYGGGTVLASSTIILEVTTEI